MPESVQISLCPLAYLLNSSQKAHSKKVTAEKRDLKMGEDHNFVILDELDWKNREEGGIAQGRSSMEISKVTMWEKCPKTTKGSIRAGWD